ncbi:chitin binding domain-containing [Micractinium conductrix]|uniref:Chitin binding domain-containing n=1 Tax=Micractinium conductrix TaxID=554055 RepID=A0A2P6VJI5_9CHLO|nr:chitin binding domain-containing [Micractinium conductrix]|eukprot:PSC74252.1 chitin binding domain-containing [Micractinium conductrix]
MAALRQLALAAAVLAAALAALPLAAAHGYMAQPAARNYIHSTYYERTQQERQAIPESYWNYCPHCLAAGGPGQVSDNGALTWPAGLNGFCGDMYYNNGNKPQVDTGRDHEAGGRYATEEIGGVYEEGGVMEIKISITAHHNGRFEFKICRILAPGPGQTWAQAEKAQMSNECFNQYVLVQAPVAGAQAPYQQFSFLPFKTWGGYSFDLTPPFYSYYYSVPDGLRCDGVYARCVLQWHWVTGNSCTPPGTPDQFKEKSINECGSTAPYPEEFWNCADIRTTPRANPPLVPGGHPCPAGDAPCFCAWKNAEGTFADTKGGCKGFFQCVPPYISAYKECGTDTLFDEGLQAGPHPTHPTFPCLVFFFR